MLQKIFFVVLRKLPSDIVLNHPLHIGINHQTAVSLFLVKDDEKGNDKCIFGALMKEYPIIYEPIEALFVQVQILDTPDFNEEEYFIYITEDFLQHYNTSYGELCYLKGVSCQNLERVVFGAKTTDAFSWFRETDSHNDLILKCSDQKLLCRQDDVLLLKPQKDHHPELSFLDYLALDCQPLRQGWISLKTSVIVADLRDSPQESSRMERVFNKRPDVFSLGRYALSLINYTSSNFLGFPLTTSVVPSSMSSLSALKLLCSYEVNVLSKLNKHFDKELVRVDASIDPLNTVFLSYNVGKNMHITNGSWVRITLLEPKKSKVRSPFEHHNKSFPQSDKERPRNTRVAQICCFSNPKASEHYFCNDKVVYISPHLWFNINKHPSVLVQPQMRLQIEHLENDFAPPMATEAHAVLIQSPCYDGNVNSQLLLSNYFRTPRYICKGDILCTDSRDSFDFHQRIQDVDHDKLRWPVVYFQISMLDGPKSTDGYLMSNQDSRLYQLGTKQSYVPITMETFCSPMPLHPIWNSVPEGLSHDICMLQDIILPFLKLQNTKCPLSSNILLSGPVGCGKTTVVKAVCRCLNLHLYQVNCHEMAGETAAVTEANLKIKIEKGLSYAPCVILLKNIHLVGKEREAASDDSRVISTLAQLLKGVNSYGSEWPVVVIATTTEAKINSALVSAFLHCVHIEAPTEEERSLLLQDILSVCDIGSDVSTVYLAQRTAGFVLGDLCALVNQAMRNAYGRIRNFVAENYLNAKEEEDLVLAAVTLVQKDLISALEKLQATFAEAIGAPKIPDVKFADIGGLSHVKQEILDTIQLPLEHPEILLSGLRRSGVLLYGPPGSGKTLLAKAVATECSLNFLSVKGPELINMYVGQSEENVRAVFNEARSAVPCIIFFDELDSLAPNRGRSGDSGGVMDRVVSQLLSELDGLNNKSEVFVIGATNRPDLIDPALLRPGRFDRLLYVGIPDDNASKLNVLKALTRKIPLSSDVNLNEIIEQCPAHLSGADFYSLCSNAVIQRVEKNVALIEKGEKTMSELNCDIQTEDFLSALQSLVPSVSPEQFLQYQAIKTKLETD